MTTPYLRRFPDPRNPYRRWVDPRLRALRPDDVAAYLLQQGGKS